MYNRVIYELTQKKKKDYSDIDKKIIKEELDRYRRIGIPIYPYVYKKEIYFRIVYQNKSIVGFNIFEKAEEAYYRLLNGESNVDEQKEEIKEEKRIATVSLNDGFEVLLRKHSAAYRNGELKYSSYSKKDSTIRIHILPYFDGKPVAEITKGDIARFVYHIKAEEMSAKTDKDGKKRQLSVAMQHEVLMYFKMLYKETVRWFDIETAVDIDREVEMPRLTKSRRQYSKEVGLKISGEYENNTKLILEELSRLDYGIYHPAFGIQLMISCTGMRIDEVVALKPEKFDYRNRTLLIDRSISWHPDKKKTKKSYVETSTKTDAERTILLPDSLAAYLNAFIERLKQLSFYSDRMYIFSRLGLARSEDMILDPYSLKSFDNNLRYAYKALGIVDEEGNADKVRNHLARHAFNTMMKNNHVEEYDRKLYMGHSTGISVNELYTHRSSEEERKIVEISERYCRFLTASISEFQALVK